MMSFVTTFQAFSATFSDQNKSAQASSPVQGLAEEHAYFRPLFGLALLSHDRHHALAFWN